MAEPFHPKPNFFDANMYQNYSDVEQAWTRKAMEHMVVHMSLISTVNPLVLRLTRFDDEIHASFRAEFPDLKVDVLDHDSLKSDENKLKWRRFCEEWKDKIEDALFGTLVRIDCSKPYTDENTIFVVRVQFLAIEIARNRLGLNNTIYEKMDKK